MPFSLALELLSSSLSVSSYRDTRGPLIPSESYMLGYSSVNHVCASSWFKMHAFWMVVIVAPIFLAGIIKGLSFKDQITAQTPALSTHKSLGIALLALFIHQLCSGIFIHWVKIPFRNGQRPPQNYIHAIIGLGIVGISFYQVWNGIKSSWVEGTGLSMPPHSAMVGWEAWVVVRPSSLFISGLDDSLTRRISTRCSHSFT